ncbi:MogA/MoaB family molybdenum cofactor biosynthesis protein [Salibacterium aidingense]|uniref:MogA/MoaB family molybdenum cofactor biosynthesis protein n=1 Tax=Salibacterium aidingense TaxID=384933 RepID=UPI0004212536|nr:molybdenum cofactor biosynthesis protein B [Salibacterium aidingense]
MTIHEHKANGPQSVGCMIITVSDTRSLSDDKSGKLIRERLEEQGHKVAEYKIIEDDYERIQSLLRQAAQETEIEAVLMNGGTGIAKRDTTYEAVKDLLDKEIPGFGELFRHLSYTEDIGAAAILSRAIAGVYENKAVFSMPGSSGAVRLAMNQLILPELSHVIREIQKDL